MRILSSLAAIVGLSALAFAQSPLTTTFANNNGNASGGAIYFDLDVLDPAGITIFNLDINTSAGFGSIDIYTTPTTWVGNNSDPTLWTLQGTGSFTVGAGLGAGTQVCFDSAGVFLPTGPVGVALVQTDCNQAYTTGTSPFPLTYATAELSLTAGGGTNTPFSTTLFSPRVWNGSIYYESGTTLGSCLPPSNVINYGEGCYSSFASFYEVLTASGMDLSGILIEGTNNGAGYDVTVGPGPGFAVPLGSTAVTLPDDGQTDTGTVGGTLGIVAGSNGWLALGAGNSNGFAPNVGAFLANPSEGLYAWTDLQPNLTTSGQVFYSEVGTVGRLTYNGVFGWNTTDPNDIDFKYDTASGDWSIEFGATGPANPEDWLVGYSQAGANLDPGARDISAGGFSLGDTDAAGLNLDSTLPSLGGSADLTASNLDASSPGAVFFFGSARIDPGVDLGFIGAPGCFAYTNADIGAVLELGGPGSVTYSLAIPADPALAGAVLTAQSTGASPANAWGVVTSNGTELSLGL